jgi:hypothetical protein
MISIQAPAQDEGDSWCIRRVLGAVNAELVRVLESQSSNRRSAVARVSRPLRVLRGAGFEQRDRKPYDKMIVEESKELVAQE